MSLALAIWAMVLVLVALLVGIVLGRRSAKDDIDRVSLDHESWLRDALERMDNRHLYALGEYLMAVAMTAKKRDWAALAITAAAKGIKWVHKS